MDWIRDRCIDPLIETYLKVKKVFDYLPILWKDYDWDWTYLLILARFKLKRMEQSLRNGKAVHTENSLSALREAQFLLGRLIKDDYLDQWYGENEKITWNNKLHRFKRGYDIKKCLVFRRSFKYWCEHEQKLRFNDLDRLGFLFRKYLFHWWD